MTQILPQTTGRIDPSLTEVGKMEGEAILEGRSRAHFEMCVSQTNLDGIN